MYFKDTGFRGLYKQFAAFMLKDNIKVCINDYPGADKANCVLTYGYIDHDAGQTMEILCAGINSGDGFSFFDSCDEIKAMLRIGSVIEDEFFVFDDNDGRISKRYAKKLNNLKVYEVSEEIEETRNMAFLDRSRHEYYPDDILVYLIKQGLNPEGCWVRISGIGDYFILGKLLNEPDQDFGCHEGENIEVFVQKTDDGSIICFSDMTPRR
ncbi:MAG: hypothetical protein J6M17_00190 [Ruminococcus sp.]|nr:hypothetical protein [Ruminococcus sp.]